MIARNAIQKRIKSPLTGMFYLFRVHCTTCFCLLTFIRNNKIFSTSVRQLFKTLSTWKPHNRAPQPLEPPVGIALSISALSPSDNQHNFFSCELDEGYPFRFATDLQSTSLAAFHRRKASELPPQTLLEHSNRPEAPHPSLEQIWSRWQKNRVQGNPLQLRPRLPKLPKVHIVNRLIIRRQYPRSIEIESLAQIVRQSLVGLKAFKYERRGFSTTYQSDKAFTKGK